METEQKTGECDSIIHALRELQIICLEETGKPLEAFYGTYELWNDIKAEIRDSSVVDIGIGFSDHPRTIWGIPFCLPGEIPNV